MRIGERTKDAHMSLKRKERTPLWTMVFDDASALRGVVDAVAAVMNRATFKVCREGDRYFLQFDGADPGMTCIVSARLHIDHVTFSTDNPDEDLSFCLECKQLIVAIDNPSCAHCALRMEGFDERVRVTMRDPEQCSFKDESEISTFVDATEPIHPDDIQTDICLELDIAKLKEMIKKAKKSHTEHLRIQIYLVDQGSTQVSVVVISISGETNAYHAQTFCHHTHRGEDGSLTVRAAADGEVEVDDVSGMETAFDGTFPVDKIDAFVRVLPVRMISTRVQTAMPLIMTHELGGGGILGGDHSKSSVRFLIAPIREDD